MEENKTTSSVTKISKETLEQEMKMQEFIGEIRKIKSSPNVQLACDVINRLSDENK